MSDDQKDKRKQSLYFPAAILARLQRISNETERSMSWLVQYALEGSWEKLEALQKIKKSSPPQPDPTPDPKRDALFGVPR